MALSPGTRTALGEAASWLGAGAVMIAAVVYFDELKAAVSPFAERRIKVDSSKWSLRRDHSYKLYTDNPFGVPFFMISRNPPKGTLTRHLFALTIIFMFKKTAGFFRPDHDPPQNVTLLIVPLLLSNLS